MSTTECIRMLWTRFLRGVVAAGWVGLSVLPLVGRAQSSPPFLGEVMCGGWDFCPAGWAECNGQQVPIADNEALFTLLGTTYGGDGQSAFALPNIQSRTVIGMDSGVGLQSRTLGETGGGEEVVLSPQQVPSHSHGLQAHSGAEKAATPRDRVPGVAPASAPIYGTGANASLAPASVSTVGGSQPHNNLQPYLAVKCCISLQGVFPTPS